LHSLKTLPMIWMKTQTCGPELDVLDETFVAWNGMSLDEKRVVWKLYVLDENHTCGAGYRMYRMKFWGGLIELNVLDENFNNWKWDDPGWK
jgi:hypothetical protein